MTKLYIAEYGGTGITGGNSDNTFALPTPPLNEQKLDTAATTGAINALGAITAGTLYTAGTYLNVPLTGGTGNGATANITVTAGGVSAVQLVNRGTGYTVADSLSAAAANIGGTGSGFAIPVSTITQLALLGPTTRLIEITADSIASLAFGPAPTGVPGQNQAAPVATVTSAPAASVSNQRMAANDRIQRAVLPNTYVSAITNT